MSKFGSQMIGRYFVMSKPYFFSEQKWSARGLLLLLVVSMLTSTAASVLLNQQTGEFTSALAAQDSARYWKSIYYAFGLIAVAIPAYGIYYYIRDLLTNHWRRWLTTRFVKRYFENSAYYKLTFAADVDNPDQRISEDINSFTARSIYFLLIFIETLLQLIAFSGVLWLISHTLVYVIIVYAIIGTGITTFVFGRPLVGLNFFQLRREADFRFSLVRVRENAESIAFYHGEDKEVPQIAEKFDHVYANYNKLIFWQFFLNLFQYAFITAPLIIPGIVLAPSVLSGQLEIGRVVQATGAFTAISNAITIIVSKFDVLSLFAAGINRLDRFSKLLKAVSVPAENEEEEIRTIEETPISIRNLTIKTPDGKRVLVKNLSLSLPDGQSLMICGPSGGGKSTLLRVFAGLRNDGTGIVSRPPLEQMMFLPQRPYMIIGSLREELLYPSITGDISEDELQEVLDTVNLPHLIERCGGLDSPADWGKLLSLGEQQRLAMARVLLAKRKYVIFDEATSAMDEKNEALVYAHLQSLSLTMISVSHRTEVARYHTHVLRLSGSGKWDLHTSEEYLEIMKKEEAQLAKRTKRVARAVHPK